MATTPRDETLQNIHDEMYTQRGEEPEKGLKTLDTETKKWIAIYLGFIVFMVYIQKLTLQQGFIFGAIGMVAIYFLISGEKKIQELTWLECQIRIYDLLLFLQRHPIGGTYRQIPLGEIKVKPIGRKQWVEGKSFKRSFAVGIYNEEIDVEEEYFVEIDIFSGDILTFRHAPEGVSGAETKDIKFVASPSMLDQKRSSEFLRGAAPK